MALDVWLGEKPTPKEAEITAAVRELRQAYHETQGQFAARLAATIRTITRYETSRPPKGEALIRLWRLAQEKKLAGVVDTLARAFLRDFLASLEDSGFMEKINEHVAEALRRNIQPALERDITEKVSTALALKKAAFKLTADEDAFLSAALKAYRRASPEERRLLADFPALVERSLWWRELEDKIRRADEGRTGAFPERPV